MGVQDGLGDVELLESRGLRVAAEQIETVLSGDSVALHEDALARSMTARRPKAPSRLWKSAKRRRTMSIALWIFAESPSVMYAKIPRFAASVTKAVSIPVLRRSNERTA